MTATPGWSPRTAGGELQVTHILRFSRRKVRIGFRHLIQVFDCSNQLDLQTRGRLAGRLEEDSGSDHGERLCRLHHGMNVVDVVAPSCECRGRRQRDGNQARILAGPEGTYEVGGRLGDDRDSLAPVQTRPDHTTCQRLRLVFQVPVWQYSQQFATAGVEVEAGPTGWRRNRAPPSMSKIRLDESGTLPHPSAATLMSP